MSALEIQCHPGMKTKSLKIEEALHACVRVEAAKRGVTLQSFVQLALESALSRQKNHKPKKP